jgi:predicted nucleic acid-binding protein
LALLDTNILLDLATDDSEWFDWSLSAVETASAASGLCVNAVILAELSVRYENPAEVDALVRAAGAEFVHIPKQAAFIAAKAFEKYRRAGGMRTGVLPDFFIGAHAQALDMPLLTRDARRYRTYFPAVRLITPQLN